MVWMHYKFFFLVFFFASDCPSLYISPPCVTELTFFSFLATQLASMRKVNEATQPHPPISTPQEFSQLKHERELKFLEKQEQYRQQMIAHQRV